MYTDSFVVTFKLFTLSGFMVERILSGRFCPLTAPLRSSRFSARSAPFSASLTLRSHALFTTPHSSETPGPILMKLEIYSPTASRTRHRMQNFRGLRRRWWSGQIASLTPENFCPFYVFSPRPQVASLDKTPRAIRHYTSFWPR